MLERLIEYISEHSGVRWCTMEEMADEFRRRHPFTG
jgi:peptidoglycan-N-acetylglucosamine deacetylase